MSRWIGLILTLFVVAGCSSVAKSEAGARAAAARQSWDGDWHAVWQIEWENAPLDGPLVAEIWHAGDDRLRIETLEAPNAALNGLTLVYDRRANWLYDVRQNLAETGPADMVRIALVNDALEAMSWTLDELPQAGIVNARQDELESGPAVRLALITESGDRAALWINRKTDLPARLELQSKTWGELVMGTRSISSPTSLAPALFQFEPPADAQITTY